MRQPFAPLATLTGTAVLLALACLLALSACDKDDSGDESTNEGPGTSGESVEADESTGTATSPSTGSQATGAAPAGLDCSADPGCAPEVVGTAPVNVHAGEVRGDRLFAFGRGGFYVVDVSDATAMTITAQIDLDADGIPIGVSAAGDLAFVLTMRQTVVVDVSDPAAPRHVATWDDTATDIEIVGTTAYLVGDFRPRMRVWDVSDPAAPSPVGEVTTDRWRGTTGPANLALHGEQLVVSDGFGLVVFDVSDPTSPTELGSSRHITTHSVAVLGDTAYVANAISGFDVVTLSDPSQPERVVEGCEGASTTQVAASDSTVYLMHDDMGDKAIFAFDASDATAPRLVGRTDIGQIASLGSAGGAYLVTRMTDEPMVFEVVALRGCL